MPKRTRTFKLGRYEVLGRIATGGMATVYRARLPGLGGFNREFALKVIHPHLTQVPGFTDRFLDEARVASRVRHPNCVATIDIDDDQGYQFLVLELIDGVTLRQLALDRRRQLAPDEAARVMADAARGLHAVHEIEDEGGQHLDVIHRDLSPHNLMLDVSGRTILIDLGLAKARGQLGHTQTGVLAGKLPYMSPEQSRLEPLDARSDVFSLGSVLFELVVGAPPFGEDHTPGTLERVRKCDRAAVARALDEHGIPEWLSGVILACLHAERDSRLPTSLALAEALEQELHRHGREGAELRRHLAIYAEETKSALGPESPPDDLAPQIESAPEQPSRLRMWLGAAAVLAITVGVGSYLSMGPAATDSRASKPSAPNLAADQPDTQPEAETAVQKPAPTVLIQPVPVLREDDGTTGGETGADADLEAEVPTRAPKRRKKRRPKLKTNPYQQ